MFPDGLIKIGDKEYLSFYGLFIAIGILCCMFTLHFLGKRQGLSKIFRDYIETIAYAAIVIGFVFAALFQGFYNFLDGKEFSLTGGITFLGGLIGGVVSFLSIYFVIRKKIPGKVTNILPIAPCCIIVAHAFGRIGCFFAGCCGGIRTDSWLGVQFPGDAYKTYPTQLFEAAFLFLLYGVLFYLIWKKNFKYSFVVYLGAYGLWRFLLEFIRGDERGSFIGNISPSQFWSLLMIVLSVPVFFLLKYLYSKVKIEQPFEDELVEENMQTEE